MKNGIIIEENEKEITIKGNQLDLEELAKYIIQIAKSKEKKDHIHLDELTLINPESSILNLIIEKDEK